MDVYFGSTESWIVVWLSLIPWILIWIHYLQVSTTNLVPPPNNILYPAFTQHEAPQHKRLAGLRLKTSVSTLHTVNLVRLSRVIINNPNNTFTLDHLLGLTVNLAPVQRWSDQQRSHNMKPEHTNWTLSNCNKLTLETLFLLLCIS